MLSGPEFPLGVPSNNGVVQSLWVGERLTTMERLAIASFVHWGHEYHLYAYNPVEGVPPGAEVRDAREILPADSVFTYQTGFGAGSYSAFSNRFRYKLLLERGGWWVDTDVVCLRPFFGLPPVVLTTEHDSPVSTGFKVASAVMRMPAGNPLMQWAWNECLRHDPATLVWGQTGPQLLQRGVHELELQRFLRPASFTSNVPYWEWRAFVDPLPPLLPVTETYGAHLFHQMWIDGGADPDAEFPPTCLYETWKQLFLGNT